MGLTNLGATCYVNTFLQMWFLNLELRQALYLCPSTCSEHTAGEGVPKDKGQWERIAVPLPAANGGFAPFLLKPYVEVLALEECYRGNLWLVLPLPVRPLCCSF